jgi:hypothetical protein
MNNKFTNENAILKPLVLKCCNAKLYLDEKCSCNLHTGQSQSHGFLFENEIRKLIFELPVETNDTNIHDIPCHKNKFNANENISIKTTGSSTICCGDILRFYDYDFSKTNTIICIQYQQTEYYKQIKHIFEINYNKECHKYLFGNITKDEMQIFVNNVKSIPVYTPRENILTFFDYKTAKQKLIENKNMHIQINPKVDSKNQRRVQCSITNFETTMQQFITYKSPTDCPNTIRKLKISTGIKSGRRLRK